MIRAVLVRLMDPPLDTPPDEARSKLRHELLRPEYNDGNVVQRFLDWMQREAGHGLDSASQAPPLSTFTAMVVGVLLVVLVGWLVSRARLTARSADEDRAVLTDEEVTADELRARADRALAEGRHEEAVVEGFRALTLRQVERGRLTDAPGATAHEVAVTLAGEFPHLRERVARGGALFDAVLYGDRSATADQARDVVTLDDDLRARR